MTDMATLAETIAYDLMGTAMSLQTALERRDAEDVGADMDSDFCARLDSLVFCCDSCDWWCEIGEMSNSGDWVCTDCQPDDDDD